MKKLAIAGIISILTILWLSGCGQGKPAEESSMGDQSSDQTLQEEVAPPEPEPYVYRSMDYGFELTFPISWGQIIINNESINHVNITSEDGEKTLRLSMMPKSDAELWMDAPLTTVGTAPEYIVYREGGFGLDILEAQGEDVSAEREVEAELQKIADTFRVIDEGGNVIEYVTYPPDAEEVIGRYFTNAYFGGTPMFDPDSDEMKPFHLSNSDKALEMLGLSEDEFEELDCLDYSRPATIVIQNYYETPEDEQSTHSLNARAELYDVLELGDPVCDVID